MGQRPQSKRSISLTHVSVDMDGSETPEQEKCLTYPRKCQYGWVSRARGVSLTHVSVDMDGSETPEQEKCLTYPRSVGMDGSETQSKQMSHLPT